MAITIRELLASDTISQATDKINFNFDQLLLNGGGPVGPRGIQGPIGPIGGRGIRGSQFYEDPAASPGTNPNTLIFADLLEDDNYLQADGTVWNYNGTQWIATPVNLTGPIGPQGPGGGFLRFGGATPTNTGSLNDQNVIYPEPMPAGSGGAIPPGASSANEAVPTLMIGGVVTTSPTRTGVTYTNSLIGDNMAKSIDSSVTSMFIHQLDSAATSITFMGGNSGDDFEQTDIGELVNMGLEADDKFFLLVPKSPTTRSTLSDLTGLTMTTTDTGQRFTSGKDIIFDTGTAATDYGIGGENNFTVNANNTSGGNQPQIVLNGFLPAGGGLGSRIILGSTGSALPDFSVAGGNAQIAGSYIFMTANVSNFIRSQQATTIESTNTDVNITASNGAADIDAQTVTVDSTQGTTITNTGSGAITIDNNNGNIVLDSSAALDFNGSSLDVDTTAGANITNDGSGNIVLQNNTGDILLTNNGASGDITLDSRDLNVTASRDVDIDANAVQVDSQADIDITTNSAGDINLTSASDIKLDATATLDVDAATVDIDSSGTVAINSATSTLIGAATTLGITTGGAMTATSSATIGLNSGDDFTITSLSGNVTTTSSTDTTINAGQDLTLSSTRYFALDSAGATTSNQNNLRFDRVNDSGLLIGNLTTNLLQHGKYAFASSPQGSNPPVIGYDTLYTRVGNCVTVHGFFQFEQNSGYTGSLQRNIAVPFRNPGGQPIQKVFGSGNITDSGSNLIGSVRIGPATATQSQQVGFTFCPIVGENFQTGGNFAVEFTYQYLLEN